VPVRSIGWEKDTVRSIISFGSGKI